MSIGGARDIVQCLDVAHHAADRKRNPGGWYQPPSSAVDKLILVAGGIEIAQKHGIHVGALEACLDCFDGCGVFGFDSETGVPSLGGGSH